MKRNGPRSYVGVGLGAGLVGALFLALRYAVRKPTKSPVPDTISPAIFATKVVETSLGEVVYHESGSGQPLIFVHGICVGASSYEWSRVYPRFADRFRVLAPDLIGFGESERPEGKLAAADYVRGLVEFIQRTCGDEPPILVGSGLGGGFCAYLAAQHPELAARLILLMPTGLKDFGREGLPLRSRVVNQSRLLRRFLYRNYEATRGSVRRWLEHGGFSDPSRVTEEMVDVFTTCAQQGGAEHAVFNLRRGRFHFDLAGRLRDVAVPVVLLWSERAEFPPLEWGIRYSETARNCRLLTFSAGGPLAALEQPDLVAETLDSLLHTELRIYRAS
jgi:pimeloyl-ACP methyl ester carboxylesterase